MTATRTGSLTFSKISPGTGLRTALDRKPAEVLE